MARGKGKANPTRPAAAQETGHTAVVEPYLHLGPCSAASNEKLLSTAGITHVLSIGATPTKTVPGITYTRLALKDEPTADLAACVAAAAAFIDEARRRKGRVIVHCSAAISRSPAVVAGYLITREGYSLKRALAIIAASRPRIAPNEGFVQQLGDIEERVRGRRSLPGIERLPARLEERLALYGSVEDQDDEGVGEDVKTDDAQEEEATQNEDTGSRVRA